MNCWEILEIGATSDEREIRRAYAKKLKTTRPDENPEGYQQLREAFDEALTIAPYYQEEQEKSTRSSDFQESAPEKAVDLAGEFIEQPQADIQPYEPENPYDESSYQFEQMAIHESQELDYSAADSLLSEVYRIATTEGETELETQWRRFYLELSELPLEQTDYVSWQAWNLFQDIQLDNPFVWKQWSTYFNWLNDYKFAQYCDIEKLAYVQEKIQLADKLNQVSTDDVLQENSIPILRAVYDRLSKGKSYVLTLFYLVLISPFVKAEMESNSLAYKESIKLIPKSDNLFSFVKIFRLLPFASFLILFLPSLVYKSVNNDPLKIFAGSIIFFLGCYLGVMRLIVPIIILAKRVFSESSLILTKQNGYVEGLLPLALIIFAAIKEPQFIYYQQTPLLFIFIMTWAIARFYIAEEFNLWFSYFIPFFVVILLATIFNLLEPNNYFIVIPSLLLWININLYIVYIHHEGIRKLQKINSIIWHEENLPTGIEILKIPFYTLISIFYWIFFLPFHTARLYYDARTMIVFIEILIAAFLLSYGISSFWEYNNKYFAITFLIASYLVVFIQLKLKNWVFRYLGIHSNN